MESGSNEDDDDDDKILPGSNEINVQIKRGFISGSQWREDVYGITDYNPNNPVLKRLKGLAQSVISVQRAIDRIEKLGARRLMLREAIRNGQIKGVTEDQAMVICKEMDEKDIEVTIENFNGYISKRGALPPPGKEIDQLLLEDPENEFSDAISELSDFVIDVRAGGLDIPGITKEKLKPERMGVAGYTIRGDRGKYRRNPKKITLQSNLKYIEEGEILSIIPLKEGIDYEVHDTGNFKNIEVYDFIPARFGKEFSFRHIKKTCKKCKDHECPIWPVWVRVKDPKDPIKAFDCEVRGTRYSIVKHISRKSKKIKTGVYCNHCINPPPKQGEGQRNRGPTFYECRCFNTYINKSYDVNEKTVTTKDETGKEEEVVVDDNKDTRQPEAELFYEIAQQIIKEAEKKSQKEKEEEAELLTYLTNRIQEEAAAEKNNLSFAEPAT